MTTHARRATRVELVPPSIPAITFFAPGIAAIVVPGFLPEAGLIVRCDFDAAHPFRTLPEVKVRHEQTCGSAVLRRQRRILVRVDDPRFAASDIGERQIRR